MVEEILRLKQEQQAVILAHNYQIPAIQDLADFVGDSLGLALQAQKTDAETIVFCGVHFMAETAAILCPDKKVLIPDLEAGCSLAASIDVAGLRAWKTEHPNAAVVVYVNCSAEVKAEADYCCTSANALKVIESIPEDKEILFAPDMFLGEYLREKSGREIKVWMGECHVHAGIRPQHIERMWKQRPDAELLIHPECGCVSSVMWHLAKGDLPVDRTRILSTSGMVESIASSPAKEFLVATETGILHQMRKRNPEKVFLPVKRDAECIYMKMITLQNLLRTLREGVYEVTLPPQILQRARLSIERMVAIT
ncbi:MAG: quinolinate synthase NadA [Acidobacteriota bacterium]